jgi:DNA invertase Pin-like site-specific DNA recombinase
MRRILDAFGAFEREIIRGRTRAALATKRAKGLKFGSTAPYGWRLNGERLEPDPEEQRMLVRLHELAANGRSLRQVAAALTTEGFTPRGRRWHPNSVRRILQATPTGS